MAPDISSKRLAKLLPAHKLILKNASEVFAAMFRFDAKKERAENVYANCPNEVEIPDVEAAAFKVMLNFIYADDLSELNGDNAMAVLYAELIELYKKAVGSGKLSLGCPSTGSGARLRVSDRCARPMTGTK
ncbi:hypothetical protein niasHS_008316 [Heterodera schachtii]|uniref:BTB domain-containing protein n=1 Tax=Heterodera schachtii TaxID=97005 RepID=A0ABD2JAB5_HETSC